MIRDPASTVLLARVSFQPHGVSVAISDAPATCRKAVRSPESSAQTAAWPRRDPREGATATGAGAEESNASKAAADGSEDPPVADRQGAADRGDGETAVKRVVQQLRLELRDALRHAYLTLEYDRGEDAQVPEGLPFDGETIGTALTSPLSSRLRAWWGKKEMVSQDVKSWNRAGAVLLQLKGLRTVMEGAWRGSTNA